LSSEQRKFFAHPTAIVEEGAIVGKGTKIWHFVHVRKGARIGKNCNIGKDVYIDVGVEIGNNVKIQNGVSVYRGVKVEDDVLEEAEKEKSIGRKSLANLINELLEIEDVLREKEDEFKTSKVERKKELKNDIRTLRNRRKKLIREISERTLAGQISLVLTEEKITEAFKKYWLDGKVIQEMDYPIFFAVNEKPIKDESGEYKYKKNPDGSLVLNEHGHPLIDHDLDEIAEAFIKFAKEQLAKGDKHFDFWEDKNGSV